MVILSVLLFLLIEFNYNREMKRIRVEYEAKMKRIYEDCDKEMIRILTEHNAAMKEIRDDFQKRSSVNFN
jgi:DNA polymerase elongation subunit (family B)